MQNLSVLQLLKILSSVQPPSSGPSPPPPSSEERQKHAEEDVPAVHAREEGENAAYAYERFLSRHEQIARAAEKRNRAP